MAFEVDNGRGECLDQNALWPQQERTAIRDLWRAGNGALHSDFSARNA